MKLQINYKHLAAEFVIVVVGVAVALAADGWRASLQDREMEREYLERIIIDLNEGKTQIQSGIESLTETRTVAISMVEHIESQSTINNDRDLVSTFVYASRTGGSGEGLAHDFTYQELISSGRFFIIEDSDIRSEIGRYFRGVDGLIAARARFDRAYWERVRGITATNANNLIESLASDEKLQSKVRAEIERDGDDIVRELNLIISQINQQLRARRNTLEANAALSTLIQNHI